MSARPVLLGANLGIRIIGILPLLIAHLLGPLAVKLTLTADAVLRIDATLRGQAFDIIPVRLPGVPVDQPAQGRIGFHHRGIDAHIPAPQQTMLLERRQNQGEDLFVNRAVQPLPNDRKTGVIGRRFGKFIVQELADRNRIGAPARQSPARWAGSSKKPTIIIFR